MKATQHFWSHNDCGKNFLSMKKGIWEWTFKSFKKLNNLIPKNQIFNIEKNLVCISLMIVAVVISLSDIDKFNIRIKRIGYTIKWIQRKEVYIYN